MLIRIFTLLLFFKIGTAFTQDLQFQTISSLNEIRGIETQGDTVWIATAGGVQKRLYDGTLLATYTKNDGLGRNGTAEIYIDKKGNKWFVNSNIITKFDNHTFTTIYVPDTLTINDILCLVVDSLDNIWMGTNGGGIVQYNGTTFKSYDATGDAYGKGSVTDIALDSLGHLWFTTLGYCIGKLDNNQVTIYREGNGVPDSNVNTLEIDAQGNILVGASSGIIKFDGESWALYDKTYEGISIGYVNDIDIYDNKIVASTSAGIIYQKDSSWYIYDKGYNAENVAQGANDTKWYGYAREHGIFSFTNKNEENKYLLPETLAGNTIYDFAMDTTGALWIASYGGVSKYDGKRWKIFKSEDGLVDNGVFGIAVDQQNRIWAVTSRGVSRYDGQNWESITIENGLFTNDIRSVRVDNKGNVWLGSIDKGLIKFDGENYILYNTDSGLIHNTVQTIFIDNQDRILVGCVDGFSIFDGNTWINHILDNSLVTGIAIDDKQRIWYGTFHKGLNVIDGDTIINYQVGEGIQGKYIGDVRFIGNKLYVAAGAVLHVFDGASWKQYTYQEGIGNSFLRKIYDDKYGNLWLGGGGGLSFTKLGVNNAPTDIVPATDSILITSAVNLLLTELYSMDNDNLEIHQYEIIAEEGTDYDKIIVTGNQLWLTSELPESQTTLKIKVRSIDSAGEIFVKTLIFYITIEPDENPITGLLSLPGNNIKVYPTLTNDILIIEGIRHSSNLLLLDLQGRRYNINNNSLLTNKYQEISIAHLPIGMYLLVINTLEKSQIFRIIKQ